MAIRNYSTITPINRFFKAMKHWCNYFRFSYMYRIGSGTLRTQKQFVIFILLILLLPVFFYLYPLILSYVCTINCEYAPSGKFYKYNSKYPMSTPIRTDEGISYKIAIVSDLDLQSKNVQEKLWVSFFKKGRLTWSSKNNRISCFWSDDEVILSTTFSTKNRGMELSELVTFNGRLLSFDDRTGLIYQIENNKAYPWLLLTDGDGKNSKGFKSEWATVKDGLLYIGSMGKEWTTPSGEFVNYDPMWIKVVSPDGVLKSVNWVDNYKKLRESIDIKFPGYVIHESGAWSDIHNSWFFLPRRCSSHQYNETTDENMSCNVLLKVDDTFTIVKVTYIGHIVPIRGFASFKFLPGSDDSIIVALKTEEYRGETATYITAFTINGDILFPDSKIATKKYEGIEFI